MVNESKQISFIMTFMYAPLIPFIEYLQLDSEKMMILSFLLMADLLIGVMKAFVIGDKITPNRFLAGILSKIIVFAIPVILAFMAKGIEQNIAEYVHWAVSALIIAETYSIMENFYVIRTKNKTSEVDLVSFVVRAIRSFIEKALQGFKV